MIRIVALLLFVGGLYGIIASIWFTKTQVLSYSKTEAEAKQYYDRWIQPGIDERMAKLNLSALPVTEQTKLQNVVTWIAIDHDKARYLTMQCNVVVANLAISFFSIVLGIIVLLWKRQSDLRKRIDKLTQPANSSCSEPATRSPQV